MAASVTNVVVAGLGGQGVVTASDILADAVFLAGYDVKKAEIHGMSQRGGSVTSDMRFGQCVLSPMVPVAEADYLVVLEQTQFAPNRYRLRLGGVLIMPELIDPADLPNRRSLNVAILGALSAYLDINEPTWLTALRARLPERLHEANEQAFRIGRAAAAKD